MESMSPNCVEILHNIRALPDIKSGIGRGRAWIRFALMQRRLAEYFGILAGSRNQLKDVYSELALMMDEDSVSMLSGLMVGLNVLEFNFVHKDEDLDNLPTAIDLSPFLREGNYLERAIDTISNPSISGDEDVDMQQEILDLSNQNSYLDEINRKLKNQIDELKIKLTETETEKLEIGFKLEGTEMKLDEMKSELEVLRLERESKESQVQQKLDTAQADMQVERETIQAMNHSLDEMYQQMKNRLELEVAHRLEIEKEVKLQTSMRVEAEEATRLLEKDIHEKQDTLVSLRQQLQDIKQLNIQLYATSEERLNQLEHKISLVKELEQKSFRMNDTLKDFQNDLKLFEKDKNAALETARSLGSQLTDKDNVISSLETDVSIEREWRTTLQAEKESFVKEIDALKAALTQVPKLQKEVESLKEEKKNLQQTISEYEVTLDDMGSKIRSKEEQLEEYREAEDRKSSWVDEKTVKNCMNCSIEFSGLVRKHHCRCCGNVFCNKCSSHKQKLPSSKEPVRVCVECKSKAS